MRKILTLCVIYRHPNILLGMKKRGFGEGKWNGFGGKVVAPETIEEAAKREMFEEAGVEVSGMEKMGVMDFEYQNDSKIHEVHIFRAEHISREPSESEEMKPAWFNVKNIPYEKMWPDDKYWMPYLLAGKKFKGSFLFGEGNVILRQKLEEVDGEGL